MHGEVRCFLSGAVVLALGVSLSLPVTAQQPEANALQAAAPAAVDQAQLEHYIRVLKSELERAEARVRQLTSLMVDLDGDIESRVDRLVSLLSSVRDSSDSSSTRLRKAKEDALKGLKSAGAFYAQERDRRKKEMNNPYAQITEEELARDVEALNKRIELRVTQALQIAASLTQHAEDPVEQYRNRDTIYARETREHRNLEKDAAASVKVKSDLAATLRASIEKLTRDVNARAMELRATTDPEKQERLKKDIETMRKTIEARRSQMEELITSSAPVRPVSSKGAYELDKMLDEMTAELRKDFAKYRSYIHERDVARTRLKPLKDRLEKAMADAAAK